VGGTSQRSTNRPVRLPAKSLRQLEQERGPFTALIIDIEGSERGLRRLERFARTLPVGHC
jgi:hypothetical protein